MIERQTELKRRHHRKMKMRKLKAKLATAQGPDKEKILYKIHRLSPFWTEAGTAPKAKTEGAPAEKAARSEEPKKKAPPKPKAEKKA